MHINHMAQADIALKKGCGRFWMDTCGGRDQVAMSLLSKGWSAYEAPMPEMIVAWSEAFSPVFIDVGANTGFYGLLALASGASHVHAFEPVDSIFRIMSHNFDVSEFSQKATLYPLAVAERTDQKMLYFPKGEHGLIETSASLNRTLRSKHSAEEVVKSFAIDDVLHAMDFKDVPVVLKIDVEMFEDKVLRGAWRFITECRPVIFSEILPGAELGVFEELCSSLSYLHCSLSKFGLEKETKIVASTLHRDHLFLPSEISDAWLSGIKELGGASVALARSWSPIKLEHKTTSR